MIQLKLSAAQARLFTRAGLARAVDPSLPMRIHPNDLAAIREALQLIPRFSADRRSAEAILRKLPDGKDDPT